MIADGAARGRMWQTCRKLIWLCAVLVCVGSGASGNVRVVDLRCEYRTNPIGVEQETPRLSWRLEAPDERRGVRQSAWQVLAASREELLRRDVGDLWDSGKVVGQETLHIPYRGKPLQSAQTVFWKVRVWDEADRVTPWSEVGRWTVGLRTPGDWKARWIGFDAAAEPDPARAHLEPHLHLRGARWIWLPGTRHESQPPGNGFFRKTILVPSRPRVVQACFLLAADDAFQLFINARPAGQGSNWRVVQCLEVTDFIKSGTNILAIHVRNAGAQPTPAGLIGKLVLLHEGGAVQEFPIDTTWRGSAMAGDGWLSALQEPVGWLPATEIASYGDAPWGTVELEKSMQAPAVYLRKSFILGKRVRRGILFASALGVYELRVNGQPADRDVLSPGWTDYRKRVHYLGYDVTDLLRRGENVLAVVLGDGWYASYLAFTGRRHYYGERPRFIAQLHLEYTDGSTQTIGTDESWRASHGPVRAADLLMGCVYDARHEMPGWDRPGFHDSRWQSVNVDEEVRVRLQAHPAPPIRRIETLPAVRVTEPKPGTYIFDLGQNMVGWVRLEARGRTGQKVVVRHAEVLNPDGTIYTENLRAARATDTYYLRGPRKRAYEPSFTFHGFRYVEVTGLDYRPALGDVTGVVVHTDLARVSSFECSEPLVNRLFLNTLWSQKGNFLDVPTDCPQRDERAGWTGDAQVFMKTACFNMDAPAFFTKWLVDLCEDSQREDGAFGDVAPHINVVGYGNTGWADAGPICCWQMWRMYGDCQILQRHYSALARFMNYLEQTSTNRVRGTGAYGDWLRLAGPQHSEVIGTAYYYYTASVMAELAAAAGYAADAERYRQLAGEIRQTFAQQFIREDGRIVDARGETGQTFYALAFALGLVPENLQAKVAAAFVRTVEERDWHLATGFLGTPMVLFALERAGHPDLAWRMALNKTYPSWLQQVIWGATTMWERWDGWHPERGFQDPGMNSFNHYWLGCVGEWLFTRAAGIDTDEPGFKSIVIRPLIPRAGAGLSWVRAHYHSIRGRIESHWHRTENSLQMEIRIPPNATARVHVPTSDPSSVKESNRPLVESPAVNVLSQGPQEVVVQVGSGRYRFTAQLPDS
ncbi:MAG: glycoside hydrolase family 78 protein [Limisphaera sp.]|nr:glycoside hydrolase family 78 protein [Limisphaera sp.]